MTSVREELIRPTKVEAREEFRIWLRYSDGASGDIDLSDLAGKGVVKAWDDRAFFESVRIAPWGAIAWGECLDLCPDALYLRLTGKPVTALFPSLGARIENA